MTEDTTTSEQLAEIEGQATDYTPPEGWRLLEVGATLREGDVTVRADGYRYPTERVGSIVGANQRYIRRIEPQPEEQPQPRPQPVQVREGRWRKRSGAEVSVKAMPTDHDHFLAAFPWWDGQESTWTCTGHLLSGGECPADLVTYLGPIEPEDKTQELPAYTPPEGWQSVPLGQVLNEIYIRPIEIEPEPEPQPQAADTADELRSEVSYLQNLLGTERRRVVELEELVTSLQKELAVAKAELKIAAAVSQQLQIELDAAQQVPADSPELRRLRSDLAEVAHDRDTYRHAHELLVQDLNAAHERTKAETVEAIVEWLEPFRGCNSPSLALLLLEALPHIIRSLTGLNPEEIE